jgi:hypothetical protein
MAFRSIQSTQEPEVVMLCVWLLDVPVSIIVATELVGMSSLRIQALEPDLLALVERAVCAR